MVAASGTRSTLYPIYFRWSDRVARAVVFPAQGPPVRHILVIGSLLSLRASRSLADATIGSSMMLLFLERDRQSSYGFAFFLWFSFSFLSSSICCRFYKSVLVLFKVGATESRGKALFSTSSSPWYFFLPYPFILSILSPASPCLESGDGVLDSTSEGESLAKISFDCFSSISLSCYETRSASCFSFSLLLIHF